MKTRMMKCSELVLDFGLYPRHAIDSHNVTAMIEAEKAGTTFPPVTIDKKSKRVTDGFHRVRMTVAVHGKGAEIEVVEKEYRDDAAMLLDAIRLNATHGKNLSPFDRTHCILLAGTLGLADDAVAGALSMTVEKVAGLRVHKSARAGTLGVAIKRPIRHMAGKQLSKVQAAANEKLGGNSQLFYVRQLVTLIEADLLDQEDEQLLEALKRLHKLLDGLLLTAA